LRFVLDTNVLVSALLSPGSKSRMAVDRAHREGAILLSLGTLTELFEVLNRKQFRGYIDEEDMRRFLAVLTREAQWIDVDMQITACRDPKDDKFLSLGDADLLVLHPFQGIRIVTPGTFLEAG
jgi:putative PIN family toxin of toxin-antitoxin system